MRVKRGVAEHGTALALGARVQKFKSSRPDHACLVAQLRVIRGISKQATDDRRTLVYTIWALLSLEPLCSSDPPRWTPVVIRVANYPPILYNVPSRFLRPTGIIPQFPFRCT